MTGTFSWRSTTTLPFNTRNMNLEYLMMWYCIRNFQYEASQKIWYSLLHQQNRYVQGFQVLFSIQQEWRYLFLHCHFKFVPLLFPQLEWYAELLGLHCSAWLLLFAICAALLGFFWLQWWLFCCMCVYIIVTFTNDLFTFYTLIYIDYISFF